MFAWCKIDKRFKGNIIILPDHLEQKIGYLAKNIQGLKKRYSARLLQLEDQEFENYFAVYADDEVEARMFAHSCDDASYDGAAPDFRM